MAKRVIDMLEPVEIKHDQRTASLCGLVGGKRAFKLFVHAMTVCKASERVKFGKARIHDLAFMFDRDVLRAAAIALKLAGCVKFWMA